MDLPVITIFLYMLSGLSMAQLDMVTGLVKMGKVKKFYNILKNSCCSYQPNDCSTSNTGRKKRTVYYPGFRDNDDDDDRLDRFERCLCDATDSSNKCHLDFPVSNDRSKKYDSNTPYRVVFHWDDNFKEFNCYIQTDFTLKCQFFKKTRLPRKYREDIELMVTYHTPEKEECREVCMMVSCVYDAEEKSEFFDEDIRPHFDTCMGTQPIMPEITTTLPLTTKRPDDNIPSTTTPVVSVITTTTTDNNGLVKDGTSGKIKGDQDKSNVPDVSGLVGGIVGGLLVAILLIIAVIFYIFRYKGKRSLSRRSADPIDRKHSVIQETLSDNIYSVMDDPVYHELGSIHYNNSIRDNEPIVRPDITTDNTYINLADSSTINGAQPLPKAPNAPKSPKIAILPPVYKNQKPPISPKPVIGLPPSARVNGASEQLTPKVPSNSKKFTEDNIVPAVDYHVYEQPTTPTEEENKYEQLGTTPYHIGPTEFNPKVRPPLSIPSTGLDVNGYTEPRISNGTIYHSGNPEYIEVGSDSGYSLAKGIQ